MKEQFIRWRPSAKALALLLRVNEVLADYERMGYKLTLRQLYYQLVSRAIIPNNVRQYKALGNLVSQGRLAGLIDWEMIEDRVRNPSWNTHWDQPERILKAAADSFYINRWKNMNYHVEVWCEKDAVSNIIEPVCRKLDVTFMANRGYSSQTAMYDASKRYLRAAQEDKELVLIYLGDHDPSGIDMTRDVKERLETMEIELKVQRIALNLDQIGQYHPPENPAKQTDSRFESYVKNFGDKSWELDALEPNVLAGIVEDAIEPYIDNDEFRRVADEEAEIKDQIRDLADKWGK